MEKRKEKRSKGRYCCVVDCHNNDLRDRHRVRFFNFPKRNPEQSELWVQKIQRVNKDGTPWKPKSWTRICSAHFMSGQYSPTRTDPDYVPSLFPPHHLPEPTAAAVDRHARHRPRREVRVQSEERLPAEMLQPEAEESLMNDMATQTDAPFEDVREFCYECHFDQQCNVATQFNGRSTNSASTETDFHSPVVCASTMTDAEDTSWVAKLESDESYKAVCGVKKDLFLVLTDMIGARVKPGRKVSVAEKMFLFLFKLKFDLPFPFLAIMFNIDRHTVSNYFSDVLDVLFDKVNYSWWLPRRCVRVTMPQVFKKNFPTCRAIIDASEIRCEKPSDVPAQVLTHSNYKSDFTLKFFISISPSGYISFISKTYGGRITDCQLTADCGFLKLLEPGDTVLADKGFPKLVEEAKLVGAFVVMPPFNRGERQFSQHENAAGYDCAAVRIHVEKTITRLKCFRVLQFIETPMIPKVDKMLRVIAFICNNFPDLIAEGK